MGAPRRITIIVIAIVLFVLVSLFLLGSGKKKPTATSSPPFAKQTRFYEVATAPLPESWIHRQKEEVAQVVSHSPLKHVKVPIWCQSQWDQLLSQGTRAFYEKMANANKKSFRECLGYLPNGQGIKELFEASCINAKQGDFPNNLCPGVLLMYRAVLIARDTVSEKNFSKLPLQILINKIFGELLQGEDHFKPIVNDLRLMAKAIQDLEPNNPSTYKLIGTVEMILDNDEGVRQFADEGLRLSPDDRTLKDIAYYVRSRDVQPNFGDFVKAHPDDDIATYHWAGQLWKHGDIEGARQLIVGLAKKFPEDQRYKSTQEKMSLTSNPNEKLFYVQVTFITEDW